MNHQEKIAYNFGKQAEFSKTYSPTYGRLFSIVQDWLTAADPHPVGRWLAEVTQANKTFEVTLLLMAGLHEAVLAEWPQTAELAQFYPSAGGDRPIDDPALPSILEHAILAVKPHLKHVFDTATVQTNETARGSVWLLPLAFTNWPTVELLDLGASAGLNLIAEQRQFDFVDKSDQAHLARLGLGEDSGIQVQTAGDFGPLRALGESPHIPAIHSRRGVDLLPFPINDKADEVRLTSYIWPDHLERVARLRQALAILQTVQRSAAPVELGAVRLPDELPSFLADLPDSTHPLVIYNTYITQYFKEERPKLREAISGWAQGQNRPVLWIQWEPKLEWMDAFGTDKALEADEFGWCVWSVDCWQNDEHHRFLLGWVHPHGLNARFLPGLQGWAEFWEKR